jgi:hypothetical protein
MLGASKEVILDQLSQLKKSVRENFASEVPDIRKR